ncbi:sulfonate ABC transporter substrate-binding protein [Entomomonas moraniae]|uniref:Putative aliphatic sulfonates-binding protein n=1 Tax=Entomomonas moraniae TaxID=2213226 RepID=A0A451ENY0_9GAMM|nr:sulfonate ABC transporter substrate-binding protein [Entomomonas moraniae]AZS51488.1 sulfonate ABC transporter substrate-binding protein [Entomomonas moraniae]
MQANYLLKAIIVIVLTILSLQVIANEQQTKELRIGYQKYGNLVLLKNRSTLDERLAKEGIKIKWIEFPAGPQLLEGLNVGSIDFGTVGETPPIFAQAANADLVYVANEIAAPKSEAILVPKGSTIKSVAELKGKRVALNKGSNVHYLLVKALDEVGLKYSDIKPVYLTPSDARVAFESNQVDAWAIWDPFQAAAETQIQAQNLRDGTGIVDNYQFYIASRSYAEKNPQILTALVEELQKIGDWPTNKPEEVTDIIAPVIGLSKEATSLAVTRKKYGTQYITPDVIKYQQKIADTFYDLKLIPKKLTVGEIIWSPESSSPSDQAHSN